MLRLRAKFMEISSRNSGAQCAAPERLRLVCHFFRLGCGDFSSLFLEGNGDIRILKTSKKGCPLSIASFSIEEHTKEDEKR
jgi:hypothetical protein